MVGQDAVELDITGDVCPMTLVRVRMGLEKVRPGGLFLVKMAGGEPVSSIPRALRDEGHEVVSLLKEGEVYNVTFRKKG